MFERRHHVTVIAEGLNIAGDVTAEGMVEMHGQIEGELKCTALRVSQRGRVKGKIISEDVVVNGIVDGPIYGTNVALESKANVTGNIHHESLSIERGASFDGRSLQKNKPAKVTSTKSAAKKTSDDADSDMPASRSGADAEDEATVRASEAS
jgi:cytoskeletal protein CcmA (bactofilin family)